MTAEARKLVVLCDFDGTLTEHDVGNDLCRSVVPELFDRVFKQYDLGNINLRAEQNILWQDFPLSQEEFEKKSIELAAPRSGANEFLEYCADKEIPFYIASCGIDRYIEAVLRKYFSPKARSAIVEIRSNRAVFSGNKIVQFFTGDDEPRSPVSLDKGKWANSLRKTYPEARLVGIGDGSSDFSMIEHVDMIFARRKLAEKCREKRISFEPFDDFYSVIKSPFFLS